MDWVNRPDVCHRGHDHAGLREEFEMDSRLRKIESKLSMLQQNTNFFIEMLHNQKRWGA